MSFPSTHARDGGVEWLSGVREPSQPCDLTELGPGTKEATVSGE